MVYANNIPTYRALGAQINMEHRRVYKYKGYDISVLVNHEGSLSVGILKGGEVINGYHNVGNPTLAEQYIDNLDFESNGVLITGGSAYGTTNIRTAKETFDKVVQDPRLREKEFTVVGNKAHLLGNSVEYAVLQEILGIDLHSWEADWFKVYYEE